MNYFTDESLMPKEITCEGASILSMLALVSESDSIAAVSALMAKKYADLFNLKTMPLPFVSKPFKHLKILVNPDNSFKFN